MRHPLFSFFVSLLILLVAGLFQLADATGSLTDTLALSIYDADSIFQIQNLQLLAEHMNIDIAAAHIVAARVWDNPVFYSEVNVWNPISKKAFDVNNGGQLYLQLQQLIKISGEHHRAVKYNKALKETAQYE